MEDRGPSAYIAEFIGTFVLVFFIGVILSVQQVGAIGLGYQDFAVIGLLHVFVLAMLIATLGGVSGAHFNPAITICLAALRKIRGADAGIYILLQLAGAVAAALVVRLMLSDEGAASNYGATGVSEKFLSGATGAGFLAELIGTFVLMWAIMGTAVNANAERSWAPLIIGGTLGFAVMAMGPLTGAGFNPARAFGPALVGDAFGGAGKWLVVYALAPVVGALLAGLSYKAIALGPPPGERPVDKLG